MTTRVKLVSISMASERIAYAVDTEGRLWKTNNIKLSSIDWDRIEQLPEDPDAEPETPKGAVVEPEPAPEPESEPEPEPEKVEDPEPEKPSETVSTDKPLVEPEEVKKPVAKKKAVSKKKASKKS